MVDNWGHGCNPGFSIYADFGCHSTAGSLSIQTGIVDSAVNPPVRLPERATHGFPGDGIGMMQPDLDHVAEPENPAHDSIVDRAELAARLQVDARTVSRMVARGELPGPCLGAGGRPRWLWGYVVDFLRNQHECSTRLDRRTQEKLK